MRPFNETQSAFQDHNENFYYPFDSTEENHIFSYTIQGTLNFSLLPWPETEPDDLYIDGNSVTVDIYSGYLRYSTRLSSQDIAVVIRATSFNETITTIQNSGYGASSSVLFMIETLFLNESDGLVKGFQNDLFHSDGIPFHAPIAFYTRNSQEIGVFCYFCKSMKERVHQIHGKQILYDNILSVYTKLNSHGHGHHFYAGDPYNFTGKSEDNCVKYYSSKRVRTNFFGEHVNCTVPYVWEFAFVNRHLNMTPTYDISRIEDDTTHKWFLQNRLGEAVKLSLPNQYMQTRGALIYFDQMKLRLMACRFKAVSQTMHFGVASALDFSSWMGIFNVVLLYGIITQKISKGIDILWIFFGKPLLCTHKKSSIFFVMLLVSLLSYIYQSVMSAESMQLSEFPSMPKLVAKGYKMWVAKGVDNMLNLGYNQLSSSTKRALKKNVGLDASTRFFDARAGNEQLHLYYDDVPKLFRTAARLNLFVSKVTLQKMGAIEKNVVVYLNKDLVCMVYDCNDFVDLPFVYTIRVWSYLSLQVSRLLSIGIEIGIYERIDRLKNAIETSTMKNLQITRANVFFEPASVNLMSAVGMSCLIHCSFSALLFLWWGCRMIYVGWYEMCQCHKLQKLCRKEVTLVTKFIPVNSHVD
ncbi:unnamed protein product [Orchesella dallaii]|uniref:Uncharacterized protein n=1 Tax=Orchesella dallaii TaxID=48710 RepID=A0ABP1RMZ4_9HEXA